MIMITFVAALVGIFLFFLSPILVIAAGIGWFAGGWFGMPVLGAITAPVAWFVYCSIEEYAP
jgi:hypothetical protein